MGTDAVKEEYSVPALERAFALLDLISVAPRTMQELCVEMKLPKTSALNMLNTMEKHGVIAKKKDGRYEVGAAIFPWAMSYYRSLNVVNAARPFLEVLVGDTPYTVHLAQLMDGCAVYIDKVEGSGYVRFATSIGQRNELYLSAVGKSLASGMSDEEIVSLLPASWNPLTSKSPRSVEKVLEDIAFVRQHGFAIEDEEFEEGVRCIGAPVLDPLGKVIAAISITALTKDLPATKFFEIGARVKQAALGISRSMGYSGDGEGLT